MDRLKQTDPLLTIAQVSALVVRIALAIGMIGIVIGMIVVAIGGAGALPDGVQVEFAGQIGREAAAIVVVILFGALVVVSLMYDFVHRLAQIIATVKDDPFVLGNAARLTRMGWLALAVQALGFAMSLLSHWADKRYATASTDFDFSFDLSLSGLGLALILFILARVFREGARMRDELEGTV